MLSGATDHAEGSWPAFHEKLDGFVIPEATVHAVPGSDRAASCPRRSGPGRI
jgi:hypothetical protein